MSLKQTYFQADWLLNDEFKIWLASVPEDNTKACCKLCKKSFGLSNMGKAALISHQMKSIETLDLHEEYESFFDFS